MTAVLAAPEAEAEPLPSAVLYLRVSTKEQTAKDGDAEGYSIPAQREACQRKASSVGAVVVAEFPERGESARSADRPMLKEMLRYLREHSVQYVIVHKVDRLARNRLDDVEINLALKQAGVTLVSATENIDETPSGMLLHGIMSTIAEFYSRNLANEVVKGMSQKAKTGGTPTRAPLGYRNIRKIVDGKEVRTVDVDPLRGPLITWAYQAYATGNWTLRRLLAELTTRGLTNPATAKFPERPLQPSHLHKTLTHPYYKGDVTWNGAVYEGRHERLVDPLTWERVQSVLSAHRVGEKQREHPHYLKSTVYCGACGSRYIVTHAKNRYGAIYPYFVCLGRHQRTKDCTRKAALIARIEELVEDFYQQVELPPEFQEQIGQLLRDDLRLGRDQAEAEARDLSLQRQRLVSQRAKLLQAHYAGAIPLDQLKDEQDRIASGLTTIDERLRITAASLDEIEINLGIALQLVTNCHQAYQQATPAVRRLLNQAFFVKLYIDDEGVVAELAEPFKTLLGPELRHLLAEEEKRRASPSIYAKGAYRTRNPAGRDGEVDMDSLREGLNQGVLVRPAGLEPATS